MENNNVNTLHYKRCDMIRIKRNRKMMTVRNETKKRFTKDSCTTRCKLCTSCIKILPKLLL